MNDELKAKYSRIANDPSQLEMFKNDQIDVNNMLQAAIDGKIGFDREVPVTYDGLNNSYTISKDDLLNVSYGVYKLISLTAEKHVIGIGVFTKSTFSLQFAIIAGELYYKRQGPGPIVFTNSDIFNYTKLYKHVINITGTDGTSTPDSLNIIIYNNIRQSFNGEYTSAFDLASALLNNNLECYLLSDSHILAIAASDEGQTTKLIISYINTTTIELVELYGYLNYTVSDTVTPL